MKHRCGQVQCAIYHQFFIYLYRNLVAMLCKCCNTICLNSNQIHWPILNAEWLLLNLPCDLLAELSK